MSSVSPASAPAERTEQSTTVIEPRAHWGVHILTELWSYRELLWVLAARDIQVRYKQTVLGAAWAIIQPVLNMVVFSVLLGRIAKLPSEGYPYPIFVYAGMLPWTYFVTVIGTAANSVVGSPHLVSKVYLPRLIIPFASVIAGLVDFAVAGSIVAILMIYYGVGLTSSILAVPLLVVALVVTALGVGTCLAALNVAYRDFRYVLPFATQLWMYATPVVYSAKLVPQKWRWLYFLNPLAGIIDAFRSSLLGQPFVLRELCMSLATALLLLVLGIAYFRSVEGRFADMI